MDGKSNNEIVKRIFKNNLPNYTLVSESAHGPYWEIKLKHDCTEIKVFGDIGFSIEIIIDRSKFELWQYDKRVNNAMKTNAQNIMYQLKVLKEFLSTYK